MSADLTAGIAREAIDCGAFDVLPKPFEMNRVLDIVDRAAGSLLSKRCWVINVAGRRPCLLLAQSSIVRAVRLPYGDQPSP